MSVPGYTIIVELNVADLNAIKKNTDIATDVNNTYLTLTADLLSSYGGENQLYEDPPGLNVLSIVNGDGVQVRNFTSDTTKPFLTNFDLDLDTGEIILTFDETVRAETLNFTHIIIQSESEYLTNVTKAI